MNSEIKQLSFEAPKDIKYYKLKYNGLEFQIVKGIILGKKQYILRDISGNECVSINLNEENKLYLSTLQYRPSCTIDRPMKKGESTILMLKGLLKFVIEHESTQDSIYFDDISEFDCVLPGDGYTINISLPYNNFILYGETWYQRHFNAETTREKLKKQMETSLVNLNTIVKNNELYKDILDEILEVIKNQGYPEYEKLNKGIHECFKTALEKSTTWMSLFYELFSSDGTLSKRMGKTNNYSCTLFNSTRDIYYTFKIPTFAYVPMKISRDIIESYTGSIEYTEEESPRTIYKGGYKTNPYFSYPYYRDYIGNGTRKTYNLKKFKTTHSIQRYFYELPWKHRKTRNSNKTPPSS